MGEDQCPSYNRGGGVGSRGRWGGSRNDVPGVMHEDYRDKSAWVCHFRLIAFAN